VGVLSVTPLSKHQTYVPGTFHGLPGGYTVSGNITDLRTDTIF
jgi:hypothetical protein